MADNYLERQMEDFKAGRLAATYRSGHRPSVRTHNVPHVLLVAQTTTWARQQIAYWQKQKARLALAIAPSPQATALWQHTGVRFYPTAELSDEAIARINADLIYHWHKISHTITQQSDPQSPQH